MISYAGAELLHGDEALIARLEDGLRLRWPFCGSPWSHPRLPGTDAAFAAPGLWPPHDCRLNVLHWPTGASRWAWGLFLADDAAIAAARLAESQQGYADFVFSDGTSSVTARLLMLPPIPAERIADGVPGLYVLPLVDERWFWWGGHHLAEITGGSTTWAALYAAIGTALGVTVTADTVASEYLYPSPSLGLAPGPIAPLLDLVAASCGQRIVRRFDGSVLALNASTSLALQATNLALLEQPDRLRLMGHVLDVRERPGLADDRSVQAPATYRLCFSRLIDWTEDPSDPYVAEVTLASLALPEYGGQAGRAGKVHTEYSSAFAGTAGAGVMSPFLPFLGDGETPANTEELDSLAERAATDYYLWALARPFAEYAGALPSSWLQDGHSDLIELRHLPERVSSAVFPGPRRSAPEGFAWPHHSATYGSHVPPRGGTSWRGSDTVFEDSSITFGTGSTLEILTGFSIHVYAPTWNIHEDFSFSIDAGKTYSVEGPGTFSIEAPLAIPPYSLTIANGPNHNVSLTSVTSSVIRLTGPTAVWSITGLSLPDLPDGITFTILNATGYPGTITHQDPGSDLTFRIVNPGGTDLTVPDGGSFRIVADDASGRWKLASGSPSVSALTTAGDLYTYGASAPARLGIGSANQMLGVVSAGGSLEYKTLVEGSGITVTHGAGTVTLAATGSYPGTTAGWTKYALSYTDFSVAARVKNVNLLALGSADFVEFAVIQVQTAFAGPGLGSFNMVLQREGGSTVDMTDACSGLAIGNMEQTGASGRNGPNGIGLDETTVPAAATTFRVRATGTGADFNLLTAGEAWIWIKVSALP